MAGALAFGIDRLEHERKTVLYEQFFTRDVTSHQAEHPEMLEGQEREITFLFADIRGFSGTARRIRP